MVVMLIFTEEKSNRFKDTKNLVYVKTAEDVMCEGKYRFVYQSIQDDIWKSTNDQTCTTNNVQCSGTGRALFQPQVMQDIDL